MGFLSDFSERYKKSKQIVDSVGADEIDFDKISAGSPMGIVGAVRGITPLLPHAIQGAKDAVKKMLIRDYTDKATNYAFRGTHLDELKDIAQNNKLFVGQSAEGVPGISAANITKDGFPIYGQGVGYISTANQFKPSGRFGEVLVDETTDPRNLQYVVNNKVINFDELRNLFKK